VESAADRLAAEGKLRIQPSIHRMTVSFAAIRNGYPRLPSAESAHLREVSYSAADSEPR